MKKLLFVLVAFVTVFALVACGGATTTAATTAAATTTATTTEAPGSLVIFQNKVEITTALTAYATAWGLANNVVVEVRTCGGDTCAYSVQILAEFQKTDQPDIFVIEGMGGYNIYVDKIRTMVGQDWLDDTDLAFKVDGVPYGFPVAVEGWGMGYNAEILEDAGVDPADLTSQAAYATAFAAIQAYYDANDMDTYAVLSMAAGSGMEWVTGLHNFNGFLSAGLDYDDSSVIDDLNDGVVSATRMAEYADWVELLFEYADPSILTVGTYDDQVQKFDSGHAAFIHQGNWIDPNLDEAEFEMGYAPHASVYGTMDSIFISAPSYYVINTDSANITNAEKFLNDLAATTAGHEYMVNEAGMVPAFKSVTLSPSGPLSAAVAEWMAAGNAYAWWQNDMPSNFGMQTLGPIYTLYAEGTIDKAGFIQRMIAAIEELGD